jgi:hypothetical protein
MKEPELITQIDIRTFEALQTYYRDSSNFNIISLLYVFISSVFIAALGLYIQNQKEKLDKFEDKRAELAKEIKKSEDDVEELTKEIKKNENDVAEIKNSAQKQEEKINNFSETVDLQYARVTALQYLGYAQVFAAIINSLCMNKAIKSEAVSEYVTRFRDSINNSFLKDSLKTLGLSNLNKKQFTNIINTIIDLLYFAVEKEHPGYTKDTHNGINGILKSLKELLQLLETGSLRNNV